MDKKLILAVLFLLASTLLIPSGCSEKVNTDLPAQGLAIAVNHNNANLNSIPEEYIQLAKQKLHIAYSHTSHGSQLTDGMSGLVDFAGAMYNWNEGGSSGALDLHDYAMPGDLGNPDRSSWAAETRSYLASHPSVNVVMWSWCGQVSSADEDDINTYLGLMNALEVDYPGVRFVYMTGHLDGTGLTGNLHLRNQQIRDYCTANKKILYDFEDIESYDPDKVYFGDKHPDDACNYDANGDGTMDGNWATEWQDTHTEGVDWYNCSAAHSQPVNANKKAYAAWHLWARLAGWNGK